MVMFPDQPVTQLIVVDSNNNIVVQIGPGPTINATGTNGAIVIDASNVIPVLYFYNINRSNWGFINLGITDATKADLGVNGGLYSSIQYPTLSVRSRLFLIGPGGLTSLGTMRQDTQAVIGGAFEYKDDTAVMSVKNATGGYISQIFMQNISNPGVADAPYIGIQAGDGTGLNGALQSFQKDGRIFFQSKGIVRTQIFDTDGIFKLWNEGWTTIAWANGWTTRGGAFPALAYKRSIGDSKVFLRGAGSGGNSASGTVIGTLPVGVRPLQNSLQNFVVAPGANGANSPAVQINTDGTIQIFDCSGATTFSLDGKFFFLD